MVMMDVNEAEKSEYWGQATSTNKTNPTSLRIGTKHGSSESRVGGGYANKPKNSINSFVNIQL